VRPGASWGSFLAKLIFRSTLPSTPPSYDLLLLPRELARLPLLTMVTHAQPRPIPGRRRHIRRHQRSDSRFASSRCPFLQADGFVPDGQEAAAPRAVRRAVHSRSGGSPRLGPLLLHANLLPARVHGSNLGVQISAKVLSQPEYYCRNFDAAARTLLLTHNCQVVSRRSYLAGMIGPPSLPHVLYCAPIIVGRQSRSGPPEWADQQLRSAVEALQN
jgi:hypothetical protein